MRILVLEDDRVQQGRIEQTLLDIGRSRNLRLEIDIAKNYGDVEKYSQYFDHYQLYLLDVSFFRKYEKLESCIGEIILFRLNKLGVVLFYDYFRILSFCAIYSVGSRFNHGAYYLFGRSNFPRIL